MPAQRLLPDAQAEEYVARVRAFAQERIVPVVAEMEAREEFPRDILRELGAMGMLGLPYSPEYGGHGAPYETYLQALEEVGGPWMGLGVAVSVHVMTCWALNTYGTDEQKRAMLPSMIAGDQLGAYALSEPQAGSDVASITTRADEQADGSWVINGDKRWIGHSGIADFYTTFARTGEGRSDLSCFIVPGDAEGLSSGEPERKLGMRANPTSPVHYRDVRVDADRLVGGRGNGMRLALGGLDSGRLAIAAIATGVAQRALDHAVGYALEREQFGSKIADFQGVQFMLADMAASVEASRAMYITAARRRDRGQPFTQQAAVAKMFATDNAMKVTTDAVQILGGVGYTEDHPVERYFREAKVTQIFEGTNQIQRVVIARNLINQMKGL